MQCSLCEAICFVSRDPTELKDDNRQTHVAELGGKHCVTYSRWQPNHSEDLRRHNGNLLKTAIGMTGS